MLKLLSCKKNCSSLAPPSRAPSRRAVGKHHAGTKSRREDFRRSGRKLERKMCALQSQLCPLCSHLTRALSSSVALTSPQESLREATKSAALQRGLTAGLVPAPRETPLETSMEMQPPRVCCGRHQTCFSALLFMGFPLWKEGKF